MSGRVRLVLRAAALLAAAAAMAGAFAVGNTQSAPSRHTVADNGVLHMQ